MKSICGTDCNSCSYGKNNGCRGCCSTNGCPFGKQCFIADYILTKGFKKYELFKAQLISEINDLNILNMPKIKELIPLNGALVNLRYPLPNGKTIQLLDDNDIYLGSQVESGFKDNDVVKCFGILANVNFILICRYEENGNNPELILYKKRK